MFVEINCVGEISDVNSCGEFSNFGVESLSLDGKETSAQSRDGNCLPTDNEASCTVTVDVGWLIMREGANCAARKEVSVFASAGRGTATR